MKYFQTTAGRIAMIPLKDFIPMLLVGEARGEIHQFNARIETMSPAIRGVDGFDDSVGAYIRAAVVMKPLSYEETFKADVFTQLNMKNLWKRDFNEMIEDLAVECLSEFGKPTWLVRILPRTFLLADPESFEFRKNDSGKALMCVKRCGVRLFKVQKVTEDEMVKNYIENPIIGASEEEVRAAFRRGF